MQRLSFDEAKLDGEKKLEIANAQKCSAVLKGSRQNFQSADRKHMIESLQDLRYVSRIPRPRVLFLSRFLLLLLRALKRLDNGRVRLLLLLLLLPGAFHNCWFFLLRQTAQRAAKSREN